MHALFQAGKWSVLQTHGLIQVNSTYITTRKPIGTVLGRIALLLFILATAMILIALPLTLFLAAWKAALVAIGLVLIYGGVSFFLRPQVDAENRGWRAGMTELDSDNLHRIMSVLFWASAPGRFAAEALLDACVLIGLAGGSEVTADAESTAVAATFPLAPSKFSRAVGQSWD